MINLLQDILNWTGSSNPSGASAGVQYNFWSGFGSDIGELALIGAVIATWKHHNCAVPRCFRLAHHKYEIKETKQYTCHKHHTKYWYDLLVKQYREDYPEQHKLINL